MIQNFDQNRDFSEISTKIKIFENFDQDRQFSKISTEFEIFKNSTKFEVYFFKFRPKSRFFFLNFD